MWTHAEKENSWSARPPHPVGVEDGSPRIPASSWQPKEEYKICVQKTVAERTLKGEITQHFQAEP